MPGSHGSTLSAGAALEMEPEVLVDTVDELEVEDPEPTGVPPLEAGAAPSVDALGAYLRDIGRYPLLTAAQEIELAQRIEAGRDAEEKLASGGMSSTARRRLERLRQDGLTARQTMIQANLRLVVSIARRYAVTGSPLLDLIQEGNIGLIHTVGKFDWRKGFKFSTYATWWIRQAIQRGHADRGRAIRLPVHIHEQMMRVRRAQGELGRLGREPSDEELAEVALVPIARVRELRGLGANVLSLESPIGDEGDGTLGELVRDRNAEEAYDDALGGIWREEIEAILSTLPPREHAILSLRFGLTGEEPLTLEQVGRRFGLTRERIRQLEAKALARLRHPSRSLQLRIET